MKNSLKKHPLKITTLTPVSIGGNQDKRMSPYSDYVISEDGASVHYIDKTALETAVMEAGLLDEFVTSISTGMDNNRSSFDLRSFITGRLGIDIEDATKFTMDNFGIDAEQRVEFQPIEKSAGRAYLPGSSVKGAIRTAMLYDWLVCTPNGLSTIKTYFFRLEQARNNEIRFGDLAKELFNEDKLMGSMRDKEMLDSHRIRISDSTFVNDWNVYALNRFRLKPHFRQQQGSQEIPIVKEAIAPNEIFHLDFDVLPPVRHTALQYLNDCDTSKLLDKLGNFTLDAIRFELNELENAENRKYQDTIDQLSEFYNDLLVRSEAGETFLRIGSSKTIYDNSLALALYNGGAERESYRAFDTFREKFWKVKDANKTYPITRSVTEGGMPLGWVKIEEQTT